MKYEVSPSTALTEINGNQPRVDAVLRQMF